MTEAEVDREDPILSCGLRETLDGEHFSTSISSALEEIERGG